ncbi:cellulose-binding domain-containing protein, partial [Streptomyces sp. NPDC056948]|uniref:cellulose-binding domain-containing protein n=1 Tax=Streptomyces sp. NPDC056948 TaxID=3345975 RepID=UPI00363E299D
VLVSVLALGVSMMPFGGSGDDLGARGDTGRQPVADPELSLPSVPSLPPATSKPAGKATENTGKSQKPGKPESSDRRTEPQGTSSPTDRAEGGESENPEDPTCRVEYDLVNQWPDGFQATVTVTTNESLDSWRVSWSFRDGQQVGQMWDASVSQNGHRVTATAADYNKSVQAGDDLAFGFLASWRGKNSPPYDFELNGQDCAKA